MNGKSETHQYAKTFFKNLRIYCKKLKNPRLKETHKNETSKTHQKCSSKISRLNEKFPRPAVF